MTLAEYAAEFYHKLGITDVFGIPGGVILELLYAFERCNGITPHLSYHEQCAGFEAIGYAQTTRLPGVAYFTRGPGVSNAITSIIDAYVDSVPVLFITAHGEANVDGIIVENQEWNSLNCMKGITKYAVRIDDIESAVSEINKSYKIAMSGRPGPVFLDFKSSLLSSIIEGDGQFDLLMDNEKEGRDVSIDIVMFIESEILKHVRPIILIGDGVNISGTAADVVQFAEINKIPIVSSRSSFFTANSSNLYFGYIGSHGIRCANYILSKADLIICLGNSLSFPKQSDSFRPISEKIDFISINIEKPGTQDNPLKISYIEYDLKVLMPVLKDCRMQYKDSDEWIRICTIIREKLYKEDITTPVSQLKALLDKVADDATIISDVGNFEFWLSLAAVLTKKPNKVLLSKKFGALGSGLGRAIGTYYGKRTRVFCFAGDQGFQLNIQELMSIAKNRLDVTVFVVNNHASGMIKQQELKKYGFVIHTTNESGYGCPSVQEVANAYGIKYMTMDAFVKDGYYYKEPIIVELEIDDGYELLPFLPKGNPIQELHPPMERKMIDELDRLQIKRKIENAY